MTEKMNPEIKKQWTDALRSGEYPQGKSALRRDGKFCCLGVLCELAAKAAVVEPSVLGSFGYGYGGHTSYLPVAVREWAGIGSGDPAAGSHTLSAHNDNGVPFSEIADLIEEYL